MRRSWLVKVRNAALPVNSSYEFVKNKFVCGKHFKPSDYERDLKNELLGLPPRHNMLKKDSVPSVFPFKAPSPPPRSAFVKRSRLVSPERPSTSKGGISTPPQPSASAQPADESSPQADAFSSPHVMSSGSEFVVSGEGSSDSGSDTDTSTENTGGMSLGCDKLIVDLDQLLWLFNKCQMCGEAVVRRNVTTCGAQVNIEWECIAGHSGKWSNCDMVRGMAAVNLLSSCAVLFTGNTYAVIRAFMDALKVQFFSKTTFNNIQNSYLLPVVNSHYELQRNIILARLMESPGVSLLGDGRSDSPGFSAKYTTYTMVEESSKEIVDMELVQVTETTSSQAMEKLGFQRVMERIEENGINVTCVTTDRSPSIRKEMKEQHSEKDHQFDCWHICKSM